VIGFTAPWVLLGLLAAGIPVLLHLFARREPPTVVFPATRYLAETARAHHRRLTLQHWLLLLIRTLLIAALVLAAAGPSLPGGPAAAHAPSAVTLVLDNSLSSATTVAGTPVVERLKHAARAILDAARAGDALWLLTAEGPPRRGSAAELSAIVDRTTALPARLDLVAAIGIAREAMTAERLPASVVVVSDLQASALAQASGSGAVVVLRPEEDPVANLGLAALVTGRQPWGPDGGSVAVQATGTAGKRAAVSLRVGTRPPRRQLAAANESILLSSGPLTAGWWPVQAELEPDELRLDDLRETAIRVADASRASWRSEDRFLATAAEVLLSNGRLIRGGDLSLGNLGQGASIVQPPGDPAQHGALNRALASRGAGWRFGELAPGSTVTDSGLVLGRHLVSRRYALTRSGNGGNQGENRGGVLATAGGLPWVVRSDNLILLGSRLDPEWTALPLSAEFVPFVDFLANRAIRGELAILDVPPGDPIALPDAATAVVREGRMRPVEGGGSFRSRETGLHFILAGRDTIGAVAVNPDPRESALTRGGDGEIRRLWPGARIAPLDRAASVAFAAGGRADLRGFFLVLAAALALADAALAGLGARRGARAA
jgi:hypothetical protein